MVHGAALGKLGWAETHFCPGFCDLDSTVFRSSEILPPALLFFGRTGSSHVAVAFCAIHFALTLKSPTSCVRACVFASQQIDRWLLVGYGR